jgi:hypothetical protein
VTLCPIIDILLNEHAGQPNLKRNLIAAGALVVGITAGLYISTLTLEHILLAALILWALGGTIISVCYGRYIAGINRLILFQARQPNAAAGAGPGMATGQAPARCFNQSRQREKHT